MRRCWDGRLRLLGFNFVRRTCGIFHGESKLEYPYNMTRPTKFLDDSAFSAQLLRISELHCPSCNHNLSGATGMRCGECGLDIEFRVQLDIDTDFRWYVSLLLGLCGLSALSLVIAFVSIVAGLSNYERAWNTILLAMCCGCIVFWIRHRDTITFNSKRGDIRKWVLLFFLLASVVMGTVAVERGGLM